MNIMIVFMVVQLFFGLVIGMYFLNLLRNQRSNRTAVDRESKKELEKLHKMRSIQLSTPLAEKTRPTSLQDIVGQKEGLKALKAALCGANPQHVIVYGPPGVGKTATARVVLEEAKKNPHSPFRTDAKFIEVDATTARFDERGIADPLIGSVHDPIYQGAGAMGVAGIPQPKPGAVTKAHGGVLFIDEIGELHPVQMNKLLKVLEDRKVFLESAYYNGEDNNIPKHIHDIFQNGLPADFRLVGATTRTPDEIPPAIRSRCMEIYFRPLLTSDIEEISEKALAKIGIPKVPEVIDVVKKYATNGRETVNIIQLAAGIAMTEHRKDLTASDVEWVINSSQISPRPDKLVPKESRIGFVNGLAVYGPNLGSLLEIEVTSIKSGNAGSGTFNVTGAVDEEELGSRSKTIRRKSMARSSVENVLTLLERIGYKPKDYDIHINFPGGVPVDGPSAGIAIVTAIVSSIQQMPVDHKLAMTGEISILGQVKPIGGVVAKVEAALQAGVEKVLIPKENWQSIFDSFENIEIIPVSNIAEVLQHAFQLDQNTQEQDVKKQFIPNFSMLQINS
ncbi:ATP-dependent protease LonB [Longirhabdus pacifica]|uniref:ATP-dependent protease LonB n=1 Tax=Longirhabdus pacifica TaxID=2305227 RepID=UPI00100920D5|nr:ATP-dependent protease LonB [Longirhabdus pacifica]